MIKQLFLFIFICRQIFNFFSGGCEISGKIKIDKLKKLFSSIGGYGYREVIIRTLTLIIFSLKQCLHWQRWCDNAGDNAWDSDTLVNRNDPIFVASPKVAKASKDTCRCRWRYRQQLLPM